MRHALRTPLSLLLLLPFVLSGCQSTQVTTSGVAVTNETLRTGAQAVHIAEIAAATVADALTAGFQAGYVPADVLQTFQAEIAPKVAAALATARLALHTLATAPQQTTTQTVLAAVLALQSELATLQGFYTAHLPIPLKGVTP